MPTAATAHRKQGREARQEVAGEENHMTTDRSAQPLEHRLAYSVDEAAKVTGLSRDLLYDQMRSGKLGYLKVGRRRIISRDHLAQFLAQQSA
jgi:excisionase family DNA binding protein